MLLAGYQSYGNLINPSLLSSSSSIHTTKEMHNMDTKKPQTNSGELHQNAKHRFFLFGLPSSISDTIKVRRTMHAEHSLRSKDELMSDVLSCNSTYRRASVGKTANTYINQLCMDTRYSLNDLTEAMDDRDGCTKYFASAALCQTN